MAIPNPVVTKEDNNVVQDILLCFSNQDINDIILLFYVFWSLETLKNIILPENIYGTKDFKNL